MSCSYENCDFKCYEDNDKCIFHYNKQDWLTPKTREFSKSYKENIKYFWSEIRRLKVEIKGDFRGFIFPKFEEYQGEFVRIEEGQHIISHTNYSDNVNFGRNPQNPHSPRLEHSNFTDVTFLGDADFSKIFLNGTTIFTNSVFEKKLLFSSEKLTNISFDNVEFKQDMNFEKFELNACKFVNTTFNNKISFTNTTFNNANFENSTFEHDISFENTTMNRVTNFKHTIFKGKLNFDNGSCSFEGKVDFTNSIFKDNVSFINYKFRGSVNFSKVEAKAINFKSSQYIKKSSESALLFKFNHGKYGDVNFTSIKMRANIEIEKSEFESIVLEKITLDKGIECIFKNVITNKFIFDEYENKSEEKVLFDFVTVNKKLEIKNVSFDEERFNHLNLQKADIEIENSAFNNNFFNSVKWGEISENRYKATRDIFRQLKSYSEQQKNFIDADGFYSLEMKERKKELRAESKELKGVERAKHFLTDTAVFYIHEKTSNFSQNWLLPIIWLFLLGMIGIICKNFNLSILSKNIYFLLPTSILLFLLPLIYKQYRKIKKFIIYWYLFFPTIALYIAFSKDKLDDIAVMINPSKIFTSISSNSISGEFIYLLYKIAILFLVYQVIITIKKKVRSK